MWNKNCFVKIYRFLRISDSFFFLPILCSKLLAIINVVNKYICSKHVIFFRLPYFTLALVNTPELHQHNRIIKSCRIRPKPILVTITEHFVVYACLHLWYISYETSLYIDIYGHTIDRETIKLSELLISHILK